MKKICFLIAISTFCFFISGTAQLPSLSKKEIKKGWILLFDGKTFDGWQKANGKIFTGKGWSINNGVLSTNPSDGRGGIL